MESGRVPRWDLLEGSLIQSTQAEPKTSGLLQQGSGQTAARGLGAGLRKAEGDLSRSVGQGQRGMDLQAPGYFLVTL